MDTRNGNIYNQEELQKLFGDVRPHFIKPIDSSMADAAKALQAERAFTTESDIASMHKTLEQKNAEAKQAQRKELEKLVSR
jgi:hypothetical protein